MLTRQLFAFLFIIGTSLVTQGQDTVKIALNGGLFMIGENYKSGNGLEIGNCIFCNAEIMNDRVILDSSKTMITRKTSNPLGYIYQEWRSAKYNKTYEEIRFPSLNFRTISFLTDNGESIEQHSNSSFPYSIIYSDNREKTVKRVRIQLSPQSTDSLIKAYNIPRDKIFTGTKFSTEVRFYENGKIKASGIIITGMNETGGNQYKVGTWSYYNTLGILDKTETHTAITKSTDKF